MTDQAHSRYAPSAAHRWMACPGSVRLCEGVPERKSPYAEEGTLAHDWLRYRMVGGAAPKEPATPEMEDAARGFKDIVRETIPNGYYEAVNERQVQLKLVPDIFGTLDFGAYNAGLDAAWIYDFKFGVGEIVEIKNNPQLRCYAQGAIDTFGWRPTTIHLGIFQPRAVHPEGRFRTETITQADLFNFQLDVEEAIARTKAPDAPLIPGEKQCRFCPAASFCPAREKQALAVVGETFSHVKQITKETLPDPKLLTPDHIGQILAAKDLIEDWFEQVQAEAYGLAMKGGHVPGRKLVAPVGRRSWSTPVDEAAGKLHSITGLPSQDFIEPTALKGVTEVEKMLKPFGKKALDQMAFLTTKKSNGKLQLVADSDSRPAVDPASQAFKDVVSLPHITGETQ